MRTRIAGSGAFEAPGRHPVPRTPRAEVIAVVVSYFPNEHLLENLDAVLSQVDRVVVVDNGTEGEAARWVQEAGSRKGVEILQNGKNLGIAAALNRGAGYAGQAGAEWLLTLDQDSRVPPGYVGALLEAHSRCEQREKVAIVAPVYRDATSARVHSFSRGGRSEPIGSLVETTMTSGNLVRLEVLARVGGFDEELFIDCVDTDLCLRLRRAGYLILESPSAVLLHRLGDATWHRTPWGHEFGVTHHSALRRYYISRNRILLYRRHLSAHPRWVARDLFTWTREVVKITLYERDVPAKLSAMARGVWHGLTGRTGNLDA